MIDMLYIDVWLDDRYAVCISGLMVACSTVVHAAGFVSRVRFPGSFPGDADICSSDSCLKLRSRVLRPVLSLRKKIPVPYLSKDVWLAPLS